MAEDDLLATRAYRCPVPVWESGAAAAAHGMAEIYAPKPRAIAAGSRLLRLRADLMLWPPSTPSAEDGERQRPPEPDQSGTPDDTTTTEGAEGVDARGRR